MEQGGYTAHERRCNGPLPRRATMMGMPPELMRDSHWCRPKTSARITSQIPLILAAWPPLISLVDFGGACAETRATAFRFDGALPLPLTGVRTRSLAFSLHLSEQKRCCRERRSTRRPHEAQSSSRTAIISSPIKKPPMGGCGESAGRARERTLSERNAGPCQPVLSRAV